MLPKLAGRMPALHRNELQMGSGFGTENRHDMQILKVSSCRLKVAGSVLLAAILSMVGLSGCSPKKESAARDAGTDTSIKAGASDSDLLMRVRFGGTAALMADTNAAYLTNIAALPETAALGKRIVERFATLSEKLVKRGTRNTEREAEPAVRETNSTSPQTTNALTALFTAGLQNGFLLELYGDRNGVTSMSLGVEADDAQAMQLSKGLAHEVTNWFNTASPGKNRNLRDGQVQFKHKDGWLNVFMAAQGTPPIQSQSVRALELNSNEVLRLEMSSAILPGPIQRSIYGGFARFELAVSPIKQSLNTLGKAVYRHDLPELGIPPTIPPNLEIDADSSFTVVRKPAAWLEANSPLYRFLPDPVPEVLFFGGGLSSPFSFFVAMPFSGREVFISNYGPRLQLNLSNLAYVTYSGPVVLDTNHFTIQWQNVPFLAPNVALQDVGTNCFLVAGAVPLSNMESSLTPTLRSRALANTNFVIVDWEFTQSRLNAWFRIGQLGLMVAGKEQLQNLSPSAQWLQSALETLPNGGNMFTEVTQNGSRELVLHRRSTLPFSSVELYWLANWMESEKFPSASFFVTDPHWDTEKRMKGGSNR
jgi:hypothetical protein